MIMDEIDTLMGRAGSLRTSGALARKEGDEAAAERSYRDALGLAMQALSREISGKSGLERVGILRMSALVALDCGEVAEARGLINEALTCDRSVAISDEWAQLRDVTAWPDEWLIAAVRRDPPDEALLDVLAGRYWKSLFARCQMLTLNQDKASDLAQQAWYRVLRTRHTLKPGGNFPAYLTTVATNLWRDSNRSARRAGPMADDRMASLDATFPTEGGETVSRKETLPDLNALRREEQKLLALDIDEALERLTPLLRDVLVSRLIDGESCAEIGRRYDRTEQTISAWVRQAIREMKEHLEGPDRVTEGKKRS